MAGKAGETKGDSIPLRVAIAQFAPVHLDKQASLTKALRVGPTRGGARFSARSFWRDVAGGLSGMARCMPGRGAVGKRCDEGGLRQAQEQQHCRSR